MDGGNLPLREVLEQLVHVDPQRLCSAQACYARVTDRVPAARYVVSTAVQIEEPGPKTYLLFTNTSGADETVYWQIVGRSN